MNTTLRSCILSLTLLHFLAGLGAQTLNPFAPLSGFSVLVHHDAGIKTADCAGAIGIGGNASFDGPVRLADFNSSNLLSKADNLPVGLLIGGELLFKYAAKVDVLGNSAVKIASLGGNKVYSGAKQMSTLGSSDLEQGPKIRLQNKQSATSILSPASFSFETAFERLNKSSDDLATLKPNAGVSINGGVASIKLSPNSLNVWNIRIEDLLAIRNIAFEQAPSIISPLVVNVFGYKDNFEWNSPKFEGITASSGLFMLFNFVQVPDLRITLNEAFIGSILAPNTTLTLAGKAKMEGQVAVNALFLHGVQVSDRPFSALIPESEAKELLEERSISAELIPVSISIFPNPCTDVLNIASSEKGIDRALIYTPLGQLVQEIQLESSSLSLRNLAAGHYFLHLVNAEGRQIATLPFQKQD